MQTVFIQYIYLILIIMGLVLLANRLRIAYPIVLVLGGLVLSFISVFSHVVIDPELVFFIFLPPLLYEAAWQTSWKELWKWRRVVTSFAFPVVILTSTVVAFVSTMLIPGFTLALGFLLGGIVSPPDAISATTIMRRVTVPKSMVSILEGESLLNDASSLVVFRFALATVITGQFFLGQALTQFFMVIIMGILIGVAVGYIFYAIHKWLPTTPGIDILLTLVTPYCMYYFAEHFHYSGVLAVVSGGLLLSNRRQKMLSYRSRIEGVNVWSSLVFALNGIVFLLIGLQMPAIVQQLGDVSLGTAIWYGVAISLTLIITRLVTALGASLFTRIMSRFITVADDSPGWRGPLVIGWAGMRGVVSLAAALSVPLLLNNGQPFPYRNLILFITFIVILITLVLQGLSLPWLINKMALKDKFMLISPEEQEFILQKKLAHHAWEYLERQHIEELSKNDYLKSLHHKLKTDKSLAFEEPDGSHHIRTKLLVSYRDAHVGMLEHQRQLLDKINHQSEFDEELIRKYLLLIDMEEYKLREKIGG